jgi:hypothetical protein
MRIHAAGAAFGGEPVIGSVLSLREFVVWGEREAITALPTELASARAR